MPRTGPSDGEIRRELLLTAHLTLLQALEANGMDRRAAALVARIAEGLRRPPRGTVEPSAGPVGLPEEERGRSARDLARLDAINAKLVRGYKPKRGEGGTVEEQRQADLRARDALEREIADKAEKREATRRQAEAEALATARGETVATDRNGVRRILDHDPIASLTWLTDDQDAAAKAIRDAYEARSAGSGVLDYTAVRGGAGHDNNRFAWRRLEAAKASMLIGQVATAITAGTFRSQLGSLIQVRSHARFRAECVSPAVALFMIRAVCGEGLTLTSQGAGRAYDRNRKALALGLDVAHEVITG